MISSVFALKEATSIPSNLVSLPETKLEEGYYMNSSLKFLLECHEELLSYKKDFYKSILEAENDTYAINESFNDVISRIKALIKKILAYIETLIKRFATKIAKFVGSDKYLLKHKSDFSKFTDDDKFEINGFNFTFSDDVPLVQIVELDLSELESKLKSVENKSIETIMATIIELIAKITDNELMDNIRGEILNVDYPISETSYINELFCAFRDGSSEEHNMMIKKPEVMKCINEYSDYNNKIKDVKRFQSNIKSEYKFIESRLQNIVTSSMRIEGSTINVNLDKQRTVDYKTSVQYNLNKLMESYMSLIQRVSDLHVKALASKLDALNAAVLQDRKILYTALNKIQSHIKNTKIMGESGFDYSDEIVYRNHLLEKVAMNNNQKHFIEECIALSESNIPELRTINEDLKMDQKNKFEKLIQIINNIIEKFTGKVKMFIKNDRAYLEKNKDTILKKKAPVYTLNNMPLYSLGINNINNWKVGAAPQLDKIIGKSEADIQKEILPAYDGNGEFADFAKRYFLCNNTDNKDIKSIDQEIAMDKLYKYCSDTIDNYLTAINNDKLAYKTITNTLLNAVNKYQPKNEFVELGSKYLYSTVLEMYINEADEDDKKSDSPEKPVTNTKPSDQNAKDDSKLDTNVPKEDDKTKDNNTSNPEDKKEENKENTSNKKAEDAANLYLKTMQIAIGAKLTAIQRIYSEYMKIIRYHVKSINGNGEDGANHSEALKPMMKEYLNAKDDKEKEAAGKKIIDYYKTKMNNTIDMKDVENLVNKNKDKLG